MSAVVTDVRIRYCPYPDCGQPVDTGDASCRACLQPLIFCSKCQQANRGFARFCRQCDNRVRLANQEPRLHETRVMDLDGLVKAVRLAEIDQLHPEMVSCGGYLWAINFAGELFRFSGGVQPEKYAALPGTGFRFPLRVTEDDDEGPILFTNNERVAFKFRIFTREHEEVFKLSDAELFKSVVLYHGDDLFFVCHDSRRDAPLVLRRVGSQDSEYQLGDSTLVENGAQPIQEINGSLCLLTSKNLVCFAQSSLVPRGEFAWHPWLLFPSSSGLSYARKADPGPLGQKQDLVRLALVDAEISELVLETSLSITAKVAVDAETGRLAVFSSDSIKLFDPDKRKPTEPRPIVDISNPEAALLTSDLLFWFESEERCLYVWHIGTHRVRKLAIFKEPATLSRLFYVNGSLFGLSNEEIWRWDLLGG
jgi:hypothetical protein